MAAIGTARRRPRGSPPRTGPATPPRGPRPRRWRRASSARSSAHGVRQVDDADPVSGLEQPSAGEALLDGEPVTRHHHGHRFRLPARRGLPVEVGAGQRRRRARCSAASRRAEANRDGPGLAAPGRPGRLRGPLPAPALRRHAQAGRAGPDPDQRAADPADGRAVQRAGRADPRDHVDRAAPPVGPDEPAVVFVTHDLEEAIALADKVVVSRPAPAPSRRSSTSTFRVRASCRRSVSTRPSSRLYGQIWEALRAEVDEAYARTTTLTEVAS